MKISHFHYSKPLEVRYQESWWPVAANRINLRGILPCIWNFIDKSCIWPPPYYPTGSAIGMYLFTPSLPPPSLPKIGIPAASGGCQIPQALFPRSLRGIRFRPWPPFFASSSCKLVQYGAKPEGVPGHDHWWFPSWTGDHWGMLFSWSWVRAHSFASFCFGIGGYLQLGKGFSGCFLLPLPVGVSVHVITLRNLSWLMLGLFLDIHFYWEPSQCTT